MSGVQNTPQVDLRVSVESLERSANGRVFGGLHLQLENIRFPSADWTDFVVVVLGWWCEGLTKLSAEPGQRLEIRFMDGPFLVRIGPIERSTVHLDLVDVSGAQPKSAPKSAEVAIETLMQAVVKAAGAIVEECRARSWSSPEIEQLAASRDALARVYRKALN